MINTRYLNDVIHTTQVIAVTCPTCHIPYGLSKEFHAARRKDHRTWYCPNGHDVWFPTGTSDEEQLRKQLEQEQARLQRALAREVALRDQKEATERSLAATRGHVTRAKKRAAAGVCQWCNRTFENVARHVAGQHPEHVEVKP